MVTREELQEDLRSSGCSVTKRTISNEMPRNGLMSRRPKKTSLLLKQHRDARLKFLRQHKERKIRFGKEYYGQMKLKLSCLVIIIEIMCGGKMAKPTHQRTLPTVKFSRGSIMIWGCFSVKGVGKISVIDGKINAPKYKQILQENLMSSVESLELPSDYIFQQDNDLKHTAKSTKKWLSENNVNVLQWPSPRIWIQFGTCGNFWKFKSEKEHQQTSIIWRQYARKNGTKYQLIIASK